MRSSNPSLRSQQARLSLHYAIVVTVLVMLLAVNANALLFDKDDGRSRSEPSEPATTDSSLLLASDQVVLARGAPVAITPGAMPTPAPFVMSYPPSNEEETASHNVVTFTNSMGCIETITAGTAGMTGSGGSPEETWIRIAGILVPAIVAIGLGVGGFLVTLHVNRRNPDGEDDWRN